ncbi:MAG TPA: GtrA family protein [Vicinamibacterales bacterium]|nr:GtrA family protein [Vicinamibacterales bacterium]
MSRAARFAWVGAGGFVVQAAALYALTAAGLSYPVATAIAVEAAILHNFLWHERWTWADRAAPGRRLSRLLRFNGSTAIVSIAGNVALMWLFVGWLRLPLLAANLLAVLTLGVVNFVSADRLVFATKLTHRLQNPTSL